MQTRNRFTSVVAMAAALLMVFSSVALADIVNTTNGDVEVEPGDTGTASFYLDENDTDDDVKGCNANESDPVRIDVTSDSSYVTIASPGYVTVTGCGAAYAQSIGYTIALEAADGHVATIAGEAPDTVDGTANGRVHSSGRSGANTTNPSYNGTGSFTVTVDAPADPCAGRTAPAAPAVEASNNAGTSGWYNTSTGAAMFTVSPAQDAEYSLDDATTWITYTGEVTLGNGEHTVVARNFLPGNDDCQRVDGASSSRSSFAVDTLAPNSPAVDVDPDPNTAGWSNSDVTVTFTEAGDNGPSGVDLCTDAVTVADETAGQVVSGSCTDKAGNVSPDTTVTIKLDETAPSVAYTSATAGPGNGPNAAGWYKAAVTATFTGTDDLSGFDSSGTLTTTDTATSGNDEGQSVTVGSPAFTDQAGNTRAVGEASESFAIDLSDPYNVAFVGGPEGGSSHYFGSVPSQPTCTADDDVSGLASCVVTGYSSAVGTHQLTATATDNAGRTATATRSYNVSAWTAVGFESPVTSDLSKVNTAKAGSTVPLKFKVFAGSDEIVDVNVIGAAWSWKGQQCSQGDAVELDVNGDAGSTSLRYEDGEFIRNWKTPMTKGCGVLTLTLADGTTVSANFRLR